MFDDDDTESKITIDLGKIKKVFSRKPADEKKIEGRVSQIEKKVRLEEDMEKSFETEVLHDDKEAQKLGRAIVADEKAENAIKNEIKEEMAKPQDDYDSKKVELDEYAKDFVNERKLGEKAKQKELLHKSSENNKDIETLKKDIQKDKNQIQKELEKEDEEEVTFDFGKLFSAFKKNDKPMESRQKEYELKKDNIKHADEEKEEEFSLDFRSAGKFLVKYKAVFLILIPLLLCVFLRMQSSTLGQTEIWAKDSVYNYYKTQISGTIDKQYPNLPATNRQTLINNEFAKMLSTEKTRIDGEIKQTADYFKASYKNERGEVYMPDIDPYFYIRFAQNILETGHPWDTEKNGVIWDDHMLAPNGRPFTTEFHEYALAWWHKFCELFSKNVSLMMTTEYFPVIISALSIIPAFFIGRMIAGTPGGFFAAMMLAVNGAFISRTMWGHADTDVWNVFFPLMITWLFLTAFESRKRTNQAILLGIAGLLTGLYSFSWGGWWYIFDFILAALVIYLIYYIVMNKGEFKHGIASIHKKYEIRNTIIVGFMYVIFSCVFVSLIRGFSAFFDFIRSPLAFTTIKAPVLSTYWPNVLTTVAELNEGSVMYAVNSVGGLMFFAIGLIGIILSIAKKKEDGEYSVNPVIFILVWLAGLIYAAMIGTGSASFISIFALLFFIAAMIGSIIYFSKRNDVEKMDIKPAVLFTIWFLCSIYASVKGVRFTLLLAPAYSIAFGVAIGVSYYFFLNVLVKELKIQKIISAGILIILGLSLFISPAIGQYNAVRQDIPIIDDAWYNSLETIRNSTANNTIITSWWDFGHHFKYIADRPVTFDGTSQDTPQARWVGKILSTSSEDEAIGILRMLDCGGNNAFDTLYLMNNDTLASVKILEEIMLQKKDDAKKTLTEKYMLTAGQADSILEYTHCNPPQAVFITSEDMIGKSGVWGHFGAWNFERAEIYYTLESSKYKNNAMASVEFMKKEFNYSQNEAEQIYYEVSAITTDRQGNDWVAPWPSYVSGISACTQDSVEIVCGNLRINLTTNEALIATAEGDKHPLSLVYPTQDNVIEKTFADNTIPYSVIIFVKDGTLQSIMSSKEIAAGMFTRLFFYEGKGLKYFKLLTHQRNIARQDIYVWNIDWQGIIEEVRASHILVNTEEEAQAVELQLKNGADFAALAKNTSIDYGSAINGGDLGYFRRGKMVVEFENVAFSTPVGNISDPVQSSFGYHIIKVTGKRNVTTE